MDKKLKKEIKFDYFQIFIKMLEGNEFKHVLFNLEPLFEYIKDKAVAERIKFINGSDEVRLQSIENTIINENQIVWELQMVRLRKGLLAGIAKDNGEFDDLHLNDDEGLGEDIAIIYDSKLCLFCIQRNRNSVSPTGFAEYLQLLFAEHLPDESKIVLKPIPSQSILDNNADRIYRKITFDFADINFENIDEARRSEALIELANVRRHFPDIHFKIEMSVGRNAKRDKGINTVETERLLDNLMKQENPNLVRVAYKENSECKVEYYDLVEEREYDIREFSYTRKVPISHDEIKDALKKLYSSRQRYFHNFLRDNIE